MSKEEYNAPVTSASNAIAQGTVIKGNVTSRTDFRVDGFIEGKIDCQGRVTVGAEGKVVGDIVCVNADILGKVEGNMRVADTLSLHSTANVKGDVSTKVLVIEPQAVFCGSCDMKGSSTVVPASGTVTLDD